ncbi:MAG: TlpA family protein disulfide reductase [Desulfobacteraceae bacterium]|nr:MAG: TlpA family protein disulfide reductase [Desulfobacteraceae bacterium]
MKQVIRTALIIIWLFGIATAGFCVDTQSAHALDEKQRLDFTLAVPQQAAAVSYLGLGGLERFSLGQIQAKVVIIEVFSMYCPICQREASDVNALYELIVSDPSLNEAVKLIGIGAGNSEFEVEFFKDKYDIPFPLFSDSDFSLHKQIGEVRTPHFFGLVIDDKQSFTVFYSQSGEVGDPRAFLDNLLKQSGVM